MRIGPVDRQRLNPTHEADITVKTGIRPIAIRKDTEAVLRII
jgi:hypothetical protein